MSLSPTAVPKRFVTLFDDTYDQRDCRAYYRMLRDHGYSNHTHAIPAFRAVLDALIRQRELDAPRIFDFASSYGIVTALLKHDISADAFLDRYDDPGLDHLDHRQMARRDAAWLTGVPRRYPQAVFAGLDVAANAVEYGRAVGLFDHAFAENLQDSPASEPLKRYLATTDLIVECGSVAHLMPVALDRMLELSAPRRPWVVTSPVRGNERKQAFEVLHDHGLSVRALGAPFRHRRFDSASEQADAIGIARAAGHDTQGYETTGYFYAQVFVAGPPDEVADLPRDGFAAVTGGLSG